jgi:hypothetical protein
MSGDAEMQEFGRARGPLMKEMNRGCANHETVRAGRP